MRWQRPPLGWYKLNWDAAFDTQKPSGVGIRAIIRNSEGAVIGTLRTNRHCIIADPFTTAEALALYHVASFCKHLGLSQIVIEGDSLQVITLLRQQTTDWSQGGFITQAAKDLLNSFTKWISSHTKRAGNQMTHLLAKDALLIDSSLHDLDVIPICVQDFIQLNSM